MIKQATKTSKSQSELTILRRYAVSKGNMAGSICNVVRSVKTVKGEVVSHDYQVWKYADGVMSCDCPAKTPYCQHKDFVEIGEMRRCDSIAPVKARRIAVKPKAIEQKKADELLVTVNAELARVKAPAATQEEIAATQAKSLRPNDPDQVAYFIQLNRRADECHKQQLEAESKRRTSAPLNGNQGFSLLKKAS
jgi:hypothetical protein